MSVHSKIREFREDRKLTHQQFADAVGVTRGAVQHWVHVDYRIPQSSAAQLAKDLERLAHQTSDTPPMKH